MKLINQGPSDKSFQAILDNYVSDEKYQKWYWAVSIVGEAYFEKYIKPNISKFQSLLITESWDNELFYGTPEGKENYKFWKRKCGYLKDALDGCPNVHLIKAKYKFHPKLYLFCSDDESSWIAFVSSCNLTEGMNDCIQSTAIISQEDDSDGKLLSSLKQTFADIPLSENIVGNAVLRKHATQAKNPTKSKDDVMKEHLPEFNNQLSKFVDSTIPFMTDTIKGARRFQLFVEFMKSGDRESMASKYNLTQERIRQLVEKGMRDSISRIKKLEQADKDRVFEDYSTLISSVCYSELTSQKSTRSEKIITRRLKYIDKLHTIFNK